MPIIYKIDEPRKRVLTNVSGDISVLDIIGHFEVARREGFLAYSELIDTSSIMRPTLSVGEVAKAGATVLNLSRREKFGSRAVVVANDTIYGLVRIFTTMMLGYIPMEVFREQITAEEWLNKQRA